MRTQKLCFLLTITVLVPSLAFSQGVASGDLHISVKDPQGQGVSNATVVARDEAKGIERAASASGGGEYDFVALPPSSYTIKVNAAGFATFNVPNVVITVGGSASLPVTLTIQGGTETVNVSSEAALIETGRTSATDLVDETRIKNLPINGRNFMDFARTDSLVMRDNAPNTGAAPTSGLNIGGQRGRSNLVNVDGADATDNSINGVRATVSQEAVKEFQIITSAYSPEYGRASGGVVNIVTRSGGNTFHGDVFGFLRNRAFQAVNPFSTAKDPAYTRVQAGTAFGGAINKNKTFYFFSYEVTRRHETGFSSIGANGFDLIPFDTTQIGLPFGSLQLTQPQIGFFTDPQNLIAVQGCFTLVTPQTCPFANDFVNYAVLAGASSGQAIKGAWPTALVQGVTGGALSAWQGFPTSCAPPGPCAPVPGSYQNLQSQMGNFPVFEGTSLYSLRLDHTITNNNHLMLRGNVSPSTVNGIEVSGENQPFGQNAYSRTSQQTYRDVAIVAQDTAVLGNNKVNDFRFQYARRGLSYFYNTAVPGGASPAVNITGFAYFGREPYSYIQRTEQRYQFSDNFSWYIGNHNTKFGVDLNYIPLKAVFTVNYGGVYDFGSVSAGNLPFDSTQCPNPNNCFQDLSPVQAYGAGIPGTYVQGLGSPSDSFKNIPIGLYWQDSWKVNPNLTLNYGLRYDLEIPPKFKAPTGLAASGYNYLGLQKGIQTDKNNIQPRFGIAWNPNSRTVIRASYGMFYDHPLLGLYFLGDASDGSSSGQLAFGGTGGCSGDGNPGNLNAIPIFQGLPLNTTGFGCAPSVNPATLAGLEYNPNQQRFSCSSAGTSCGVSSTSVFLQQNYLNPSNFLPLGFQPFGYPQGKNFVYAYSQQANLSVERDLGRGYALSLAYNFNGGRHLNRPINVNTVRGDLMIKNFFSALAAGQNVSSPFTVGGGNTHCGNGPAGPWVSSSLMNFFRPSGLNPSIAGALLSVGDFTCVAQAEQMAVALKSQGFNTACNPLSGSFNGCIPFGDMDGNFSNGSSVYHGFTANLRKRFSGHYEFLASYTWSHAIDDSTDLQSTLTPQDSYYPAYDRSTSTFDQRHRFVFSGVYQTGHRSGGGFANAFLSDWTFAPLIEFGAGRPFNIITGNGDNLQLSGLTGRPNTTTNPACGQIVKSKFSPTGVLQEPCVAQFVPVFFATGATPTLLQLDGNLGRNAGLTPWSVFNDLRVSKLIVFREHTNLELIVDMFNVANRYNVAAVSPLFTNAGQPTAAYDPRQFQFGMKFNW